MNVGPKPKPAMNMSAASSFRTQRVFGSIKTEANGRAPLMTCGLTTAEITPLKLSTTRLLSAELKMMASKYQTLRIQKVVATTHVSSDTADTSVKSRPLILH